MEIEEKFIVKYLKEHFTKIDNSVLNFLAYSKDTNIIVVKGTVEEWKKFLNNEVK